MQLFLKILVSVCVILLATAIARKVPSIAGLIAVMPLTGALVLVLVYLENEGNSTVMQAFTKGAVLGMIPTVLFFLVAWFCFKRQMPLLLVLITSFGAWIMSAVVHQWMLRP